jgi:hypothetical protein
MKKTFILMAGSSLLAACASPHGPQAIQRAATPTPVMQQNEASMPLPPPSPKPSLPPPPPTPTTLPPPVVVTPPVAKPAAANPRALLDKLLPDNISTRTAWRDDLASAFTNLQIPHTAENYCAAIAVIEQESTFQADPVVPGLPKIVWSKIGDKAGNYYVPLPIVKTALLKKSPNGQSYKARIDSLRTEKEMNDLFEDMSAEAQNLGLPMGMKNPIRTGGPMQVSVEFAEAHVRAWPYPYARSGSIRDEVFSRRGGVYFGSAILLQYPAPYTEMRYRFADFNAGRYASRNAAFQQALAKLSGSKLALDGDLLRYQNGQPGREASSTQQALAKLRSRLGLSDADILRDLKQEKSAGFAQTALYNRIMQLADQQLGHKTPREVMPDIRLQSPKITRKLTTAWFAERVDGRYQRCLARR